MNNQFFFCLFLSAFLTAISKAFPIDIWIGLYTDNMSQDYKWADGTALDYTAWGAGQPSGDPVRQGISSLILSVIQFSAIKLVRVLCFLGLANLTSYQGPRDF